MALIVGDQNKKLIVDTNKELSELKGDLTDQEARVSLARFLRYNLGFTTDLALGLTLESYQELTLNSFFNRNYWKNLTIGISEFVSKNFIIIKKQINIEFFIHSYIPDFILNFFQFTGYIFSITNN